MPWPQFFSCGVFSSCLVFWMICFVPTSVKVTYAKIPYSDINRTDDRQHRDLSSNSLRHISTWFEFSKAKAAIQTTKSEMLLQKKMKLKKTKVYSLHQKKVYIILAPKASRSTQFLRVSVLCIWPPQFWVLGLKKVYTFFWGSLYTLDTGILFENGDPVLELLRWVFHYRIKKLWMVIQSKWNLPW